jgi:hypothetical protein
VQLEGVGPVSVRLLALQRLGQVDDLDGLEGTLLDTNAATDAQVLGYVSELGVHCHLNAFFAQLDDGALLLALLSALLGFALLLVDDCHSRELALILVGLGLLGWHD